MITKYLGVDFFPLTFFFFFVRSLITNWLEVCENVTVVVWTNKEELIVCGRSKATVNQNEKQTSMRRVQIKVAPIFGPDTNFLSKPSSDNPHMSLFCDSHTATHEDNVQYKFLKKVRQSSGIRLEVVKIKWSAPSRGLFQWHPDNGGVNHNDPISRIFLGLNLGLSSFRVINKP